MSDVTTLGIFAAATLALLVALSGTAGGWLRRKYKSANFRRNQRYLSGSIYLALGVTTAISGSGKD